MHLEGSADTFALRLLGYQFETADNWWDANWLVVEVTAQLQGRRWRARDAAVLTVDVAELADWLGRVATGQEVPDEIAFLEPCLAFALEGGVAHARALHVDLAHELSPPWLQGDERLDGVRLRVSADPVALMDAAASLRQQLEILPSRGTQGEADQ